MTQELVDETLEVVCLRCGAFIPVPNSARHSLTGSFTSDHRVPVFIARCERCGKEGCYLASEIIETPVTPEPFRPAA